MTTGRALAVSAELITKIFPRELADLFLSARRSLAACEDLSLGDLY